MNSIDFCFWLQGYFEIHGKAEVTPEQAEVIKSHLALVFVHEIDELRNKQTTTTPSLMQQIHDSHLSSLAPYRPKQPNDPQMRC